MDKRGERGERVRGESGGGRGEREGSGGFVEEEMLEVGGRERRGGGREGGRREKISEGKEGKIF